MRLLVLVQALARSQQVHLLVFVDIGSSRALTSLNRGFGRNKDLLTIFVFAADGFDKLGRTGGSVSRSRPRTILVALTLLSTVLCLILLGKY